MKQIRILALLLIYINMQKLVENQFEENPVNENELEELYGGSGGCDYCGVDGFCKRVSLADEDSEENIVF